jgi:formate hydrogenlyase subunit 6/NADH:ubiquinone oxidoreductase subunit I
MTQDTIPIYVMGKRYQVPHSLTIMKAMEYAGYKLIRGCGCRGGFCGACATVYRVEGDPHLHYALACQEVARPGMHLVQIPFFPAERASYQLSEMDATPSTLFRTYPKLLQCLGCGACTKVCPQEIDVREYMANAMKGDIAAVAEMSFDCIMCGLCATRCPTEQAQYRIAILCQRLYGRSLAPESEHLHDRVQEIEEGKFDAPLQELRALAVEELRLRYDEREIEE